MSLNDNRIRKARLFTLSDRTMDRLRKFPNASKTIDFAVEEYCRKMRRRRF